MTCSERATQGPMPPAGGAIGLGLGTWTLLKGPGLLDPQFDAKHAKRSCGATLPSTVCAQRPTWHASRADAHAAAPSARSVPKLAVWSVWVAWAPRTSRVDLSCHETRTIGDQNPVSRTSMCDSGVGVRWEESESAHLKPPAADPSRSAPSAATMRGSYAPSCDETSTPRCQHGGWTGKGGTGGIQRRGTPSGSSKVVDDDDLAHQQCGGDG